jgi:hypothetical protein
MALVKRGQYFYGDGAADIAEELRRYSRTNGYVAARFAEAVCTCAGRHFSLWVDDTQGAAVRVCASCNLRHAMADSSKYLHVARLEECECPCGGGAFEITAGAALYEDSEEVRWLYIGCRCVRCGLTACYADWKYDGDSAAELLRNV